MGRQVDFWRQRALEAEQTLQSYREQEAADRAEMQADFLLRLEQHRFGYDCVRRAIDRCGSMMRPPVHWSAALKGEELDAFIDRLLHHVTFGMEIEDHLGQRGISQLIQNDDTVRSAWEMVLFTLKLSERENGDS